jgi:outer membrane protein OmpA-like peptidoglycan-associated protein
VLDGAAATLLRYPDMLVEVAGHTDSVGSKGSNQRLSVNRANTVRQYLINKGVVSENLTARGYGDTLPVEENNTVEGRAANRRVELRILKK